jgi:putative transposase
MPRANRYFLPGQIWHLTHRCHDKKFLLNIEEDRRIWSHWVCETRKKENFCVLNYCVTCNHVHLLVKDKTGDGSISRAMQLIAGSTAQNYNRRKKRHGAFWEDRYHATAVQSNEHFVNCNVYINLNMVRAGVVRSPEEWPYCGYSDIINARRRNRLIDYQELVTTMNVDSFSNLQKLFKEITEAALNDSSRKMLIRQDVWTESVAVGSKEYVEGIKNQLRCRISKRRDIEKNGDIHFLRESASAYTGDLSGEIDCITHENTEFWESGC